PAPPSYAAVRAPLRLLANAALAFVVACASPHTSPPGETAEGAASPSKGATAAPSSSGGSEARGPLAEEVAAALGVPASRVELTIDPALQRIVDEEMPRVISEWTPAAATAIILEPGTGEILAIADAKTARRAVVTGSTLKMVTIAAALDTGAVRPEDR